MMDRQTKIWWISKLSFSIFWCFLSMKYFPYQDKMPPVQKAVCEIKGETHTYYLIWVWVGLNWNNPELELNKSKCDISYFQKMKTTVLIVCSTFLIFYLTLKMRIDRLAGKDLLMIPQRQSEYKVLTSSMKVKKSDIPDWISCPPAVIKFSYILVQNVTLILGVPLPDIKGTPNLRGMYYSE